MTDPRLDRVMEAIAHPAPLDDDPRDHETAWEMRHDPETDLDRAEDMYETEMDRRWE